MTDSWTDRSFLRGSHYQTDANLAARQSIYSYQHPRIDLVARVLDLAGPARHETIVDVGCGNGAYLAELAGRGFLGQVIGVDLSLGMLAAARRRLSDAGRAGAAGPRAGSATAGTLDVSLANADAAALPLGDGVADLALAPHMLYHVPDPARAVRELRRVTRPGGRVVIVLNGAGHLRQLRAAVAAARGDDITLLRERVTLDDGESMARAVFHRVTRHDFVAELRVPAPDPVVGYLRSMAGTRHHADEERVEAVLAAIPRSPEGHFIITSHAGCLVCEGT